MMEKKLAVFDIDGTLIRWQLYHAIADHLVKLGYVEPAVYQSSRQARMAWKKRSPGASFKTYEAELVRVYETVLRSLTPQQFGAAIDSVFDEYQDQVYTYTRDLIADLKKLGYLLFAISGSQVEIVEKIAAHYGFDDYRATTYERRGDKFTGESRHFLARKDQALQAMASQHRAVFEDSIAVGDSLSDVKMLQLVEKPIAFNPDKDLLQQALKNDWPIVIERKNVIYQLESRDGQYRLVTTD